MGSPQRCPIQPAYEAGDYGAGDHEAGNRKAGDLADDDSSDFEYTITPGFDQGWSNFECRHLRELLDCTDSAGRKQARENVRQIRACAAKECAVAEATRSKRRKRRR